MDKKYFHGEINKFHNFVFKNIEPKPIQIYEVEVKSSSKIESKNGYQFENKDLINLCKMMQNLEGYDYEYFKNSEFTKIRFYFIECLLIFLHFCIFCLF